METFEALDAGTDYEEAMEMFELSFGFNPSLDLFPRLDGEWGFGLIPSSKGILAEEGDIPFGFVLLSETSDVEGLHTVCDDFSMNAELQGMGQVDTREDQAAVYYEMVDMFSGSTIVAYGAGSEYFFIGSSAETVQDLFSNRASLSESVTYRNVWKSFPRDMTPLLYIDVDGIIANLREYMSAAERVSFDEDLEGFWNKINFLALGGMPMEKDMMQATFILFIETD
jgi:hypothetical protein